MRVAAGVLLGIMVSGLVAIGVTSGDAATQAPPGFWTPLPQTEAGRVGIYTACSNGTRLWLVEGGPNASPAITSQPDPTCR